MKSEAFVFENKSGETVRFVNWQSSDLYIIQRHDNRRIEFLSSTDTYEKEEIKFDLITKLKKSEVAKSGYAIRGIGRLRLLDTAAHVQADVQPTPEQEDKLPSYLKYTAAASLLLLLLSISTSWIINKYFTEKYSEPVVVQVAPQMRSLKTKTVSMTAKNPRARVSNRTVVAKSKVRNKSVAHNGKGTGRHSTSMVNRGALGALGGGYSKTTFGSGGLNINAKTNNAGIGYGGPAMRGGSERGLVGKGLVQSGIGGSSQHSMKGYGGYGTSGLGGGKPGYGSMKMAGTSGGYFMPLADESLVEGGLDPDQINAVIQRNIGKFIYCYEQGLQSKPKLAGRVAIKFVINGGGAVNTADISQTSLRSNKVESCILSRLRALQFPRPTGNVNVRVTYPFVLKRNT